MLRLVEEKNSAKFYRVIMKQRSNLCDIDLRSFSLPARFWL